MTRPAGVACDLGAFERDPSDCVTSDVTACLLGGRFEVSVRWADFEGGSGPGRAMAFSGQRAYSDESGHPFRGNPATW